MASEGKRDFLRVVLAYFLPPVGVFLQSGAGSTLIVNIVLCFLGWIPAQVHAVWVIASTGPDGRPDPDGTRTFFALLAAALVPPLGVFLKKGAAVGPLVLNVVLCLLFWIPGMLHAVWVITSDD